METLRAQIIELSDDIELLQNRGGVVGSSQGYKPKDRTDKLERMYKELEYLQSEYKTREGYVYLKLKELKAIAKEKGIVPKRDKRRRTTWLKALQYEYVSVKEII